MVRFLPRSFAGQTIIVLLLGLGVSHLLSMAILSADRSGVLAMFSGRQIINQIAAITRLLDETPSQWRDAILRATDGPTLSVEIAPASPLSAVAQEGVMNSILTRALLAVLNTKRPDQVLIAVFTNAKNNIGTAAMPMTPEQIMEPMFHTHTSAMVLAASVQLGDGQWLNFNTELPDQGSIWSARAVLSLLLMGIAVVVFSLWLIQRLTRPLRRFASAAEHLGKDVTAPPMIETGPTEVRQATRAFNTMQEQVRRLVENRTRMLAAISHDLRTPITLLRLRLESVTDRNERQRMLATLDTMDAIIASTLSFAQEDARQEEAVEVDLGALLDSICEDMRDTGSQIDCDPPAGLVYRCRPIGLRRALINLLENAIKYGGRAEVRVHTTTGGIEIVICDPGPGVPADEIEQVFLPFYRVEKSRNLESGGVGLGLSVTRSIIDRHGGEIFLANRPEGGLQVKVVLPV